MWPYYSQFQENQTPNSKKHVFSNVFFCSRTWQKRCLHVAHRAWIWKTMFFVRFLPTDFFTLFWANPQWSANFLKAAFRVIKSRKRCSHVAWFNRISKNTILKTFLLGKKRDFFISAFRQKNQFFGAKLWQPVVKSWATRISISATIFVFVTKTCKFEISVFDDLCAFLMKKWRTAHRQSVGKKLDLTQKKLQTISKAFFFCEGKL